MTEQLSQVLLGFDFGTRRIGVAIGQTITQTANPLTVLSAQDGIPRWDELTKILKTWQPDGLVVGIPLNMDGTEQSITLRARNFAQELAERFKLPVYEIDERLTSVAARERVFTDGGYKALKGAKIDAIAAQLILQNWLSQH